VPVIAFLVDQNFNEHIVRGLRQRMPSWDCLFARDVDLAEASDPMVLEWAADHGRILLTHDRRTIPSFAQARITVGLPMPGIFLVGDDMPIGQAID
jgi:predicted nuclease of predicted toxin-antitoxin system